MTESAAGEKIPPGSISHNLAMYVDKVAVDVDRVQNTDPHPGEG